MRNPLSYLPLASGLLVLVLSLIVGVVTVTSRKTATAQLGWDQNVTTEAADQVASFTLSPATGDYTFNGKTTYPVGIILDSAGKSVDGVDVIINFDPKKVAVEGSKIAPTNVFEESPANVVDNVNGQIRLSSLTFKARPVTGIIATFQIKPLARGTANFTFQFSPGSTTDSNVAEHGTAKDVLGKVENGKYTFK
jgi:hypothetical protein